MEQDPGRNPENPLAEMLTAVHSISIDIRDMDPQAYKKRLLDI